jgi:hypothetical protein
MSEGCCDSLERCGFFKKYQGSIHSACRTMIKMYCQGSKMDLCKRKAFRKATGQPPPDDMMPSGYTIIT